MLLADEGAVLDTGALVGFERNDRRVVAVVVRALDHGDTLFVPAGVVAQAWRDGALQARVARLLGRTANLRAMQRVLRLSSTLNLQWVVTHLAYELVHDDAEFDALDAWRPRTDV